MILVSTAVVCAALAVFFLAQGLDRADKYASVLALFATVILAGMSYLARPGRPTRERAGEPGGVPNSGGRYSVIVNARQVDQQNTGDHQTINYRKGS